MENRVIRRGREKIKTFAQNKFNPKTHPHDQGERMRAILERYGQVGEIYVYKSDRNGGQWTIFDGHLRQDLDPEQEWDIAWTSLTDEEVDELVLFYDPVAALAQIDPASFIALTANHEADDKALAEFLSEMAAECGIPSSSSRPENKDEQPRLGQGKPIICPECGYQFTSS